MVTEITGKQYFELTIWFFIFRIKFGRIIVSWTNFLLIFGRQPGTATRASITARKTTSFGLFTNCIYTTKLSGKTGKLRCKLIWVNCFYCGAENFCFTFTPLTSRGWGARNPPPLIPHNPTHFRPTVKVSGKVAGILLRFDSPGLMNFTRLVWPWLHFTWIESSLPVYGTTRFCRESFDIIHQPRESGTDTETSKSDE